MSRDPTSLWDGLPGDWDAAAAEYALGLLSEEEARAFEQRMLAEPELRQDLAAWTSYFAALTDDIPEAQPEPQVLRRIEAAAFGTPERRPLWRQVLPYGIGAIVGAALAWAVANSQMLLPAPPELQAALAPVDSEISLDARFDPESGVLAVSAVSGPVPDGRVLELWLIPARDGATPISLGLLAAEGETLLTLPPVLTEELAGATLAVSDEPPGGSATGAPTGAVRAAGTMS